MTTDPANPITVVVVDDAATLRLMIQAFLTAAPQTEVLSVAEDGAEGVLAALEHRPDVIVMDVQMPNLDGIAASKEILSQWPEAQIIIHSAYDDETLRDEASSHGVKAYVTKDQRPTALIKAILELGHTPA